jgi:hypothetical protein
MVLAYLYDILLYLYSTLRFYTPLFPQSALYSHSPYNLFLYNLYPYNPHLYNLHLYNLLIPQSSLYILLIPLYLQTNGRQSIISICI